jgi:Ca2+-transporting ATPase
MNEQTVMEIYTVDETVQLGTISAPPVKVAPALRKALQVGCLCNNAFIEDGGKVVGQSTDVALIKVLDTFGISDERRVRHTFFRSVMWSLNLHMVHFQDFQRLSERPFNSEQKYMAISGTHKTDDDERERCYMKGAMEAVLDKCRFYYVSEDSSPPLDSTMRARIMAKATEAADRGLRVIALAYGFGGLDDRRPPTRTSSPSPMTLDRSTTPSSSVAAGTRVPNSNLIFVGFQAMLDPPRRGVADSISLLQAGGVQVVMITGDAEHTALAIARQLGLRVQPGSSSCLTGQAIDQMSRAQLRERVASVSVFARTTPRHKMAIVEAFRDRGAVVAMTGDGGMWRRIDIRHRFWPTYNPTVNDAPALKMADIGVSMGKSGTDVAKEAADMILVDDNFSTILPAVEEGSCRNVSCSRPQSH